MSIQDKANEIEKIVAALDAIRFGSVEITIHDSRIVQIEIREKIRFEKGKLLKFSSETEQASAENNDVSVTHGDQTRTLPSYRSPGQLTFFSYLTDALADGSVSRISPQFHFYNGPVTFIGEYVVSKQNISRLVTSGEVKNSAWQIAGALLLTGEKSTPKSLEPKNPFDPGQGTWGALQLTVRYSALDIDNDAFILGFSDSTKSAESARELAAGVNWYWNRNAKVVFNYERTNCDDGTLSGDRETENAFLARLQLAF